VKVEVVVRVNGRMCTDSLRSKPTQVACAQRPLLFVRLLRLIQAFGIEGGMIPLDRR